MFLVDKNLPVKSKALLFGALMLAVSQKKLMFVPVFGDYRYLVQDYSRKYLVSLKKQIQKLSAL